MSLILDYEQPIKIGFFPVGSVSISDGIVTNFSQDNYVQTKQIPYLEGTFEFRVCGSITYTPTDNEHLIPILSGCGGVNIGTNRYAYLWLSGIVSEQKGNVQYDLNKEYIWSWKHTAGNYSLLYSEDNGQTWNTDISINSNNTITNNEVLKIGGGYTNKIYQYWRGYVDLNKTSLVINDKEWIYNMKEIGEVSINPVGDVIIIDGEATDFSATSILQTSQPLDLSNTSYEIHCRFKCTSVSSENVIFRNKDLGGLTATIYNGYIYLYPQTVGQSSSTEWQLWSISNNIIYDFAVKRKGNTFYISNTNVSTGTVSSTTKTASNLVSSTTDGFCFGGGSASFSAKYLRGTIYTYYTYIMVNGEIWAGQNGTGLLEPSNIIIDDGANQTEANYLIVDNKLVWANPKIYLQNNSNWNAYINTGIVPTNDMRFDVTAQITDTSTTWDGALFGERNASNQAPTTFLLWHNTNRDGWGSFCYGQNWSANWNNLTPSIKGTKNRFKYDGTTLTINGKAPTTGNWISKSSFFTTYPIFLYGFNSSGSLENRRFHGRIYNATFWSGNTKLAEFVPVQQGLVIGSYTVPSNGMWDIVSQTFYGNSGSGDFEIGGFAQDYIIQNGNIVYVNPNIYLESSGTQYIDTGVSATFDTVGVDFMFMRTATGTSSQEEGLFGGKSAGDNQTAVIYNPNTQKYTLNSWCGSGTAAAITNSFASDVKYSLELNFNGATGRTWTFNGTTGSTTKSNTARSNAGTFTIFADGTTPYAYFRGRFYSAKITRNGVLERHLVPVPQGLVIGTYTTPSAGMWDIVNKQFYANAGSGTFTWGKDE